MSETSGTVHHFRTSTAAPTSSPAPPQHIQSINEFSARHTYELFAEIKETMEKNGGGGYNGGMEARIAKLEALMETVQADISSIKTSITENYDKVFKVICGAFLLGLTGLVISYFALSAEIKSNNDKVHSMHLEIKDSIHDLSSSIQQSNTATQNPSAP